MSLYLTPLEINLIHCTILTYLGTLVYFKGVQFFLLKFRDMFRMNLANKNFGFT